MPANSVGRLLITLMASKPPSRIMIPATLIMPRRLACGAYGMSRIDLVYVRQGRTSRYLCCRDRRESEHR